MNNLGQNARDEIRSKIKKKIRIYMFHCVLSITKITLSAVFLYLNEKKCDLPLENWLYLLMVNEAISLVCSIADSYSKMSLLNSEHPDLSQNESYDSTFFNPDYIFSERSNQVCSNYIVIKELNKMSFFYYIFFDLIPFFLGFIFFFSCGAICYFSSPNPTADKVIFLIFFAFFSQKKKKKKE